MNNISFKKISFELKKINIARFDLVVGIASGGIVPASLIAERIGADLKIIRINYRDEFNIPQRAEPVCLDKISVRSKHSRILIVDDVSVTGKTLELARRLLKGSIIKTFVLKGKADYVLFPKIKACVRWPWKI
ncbi:MAG: phosphoribosyltransferase [Candidatus Omnitrophota bacterium]|nr:phosphoribosyltransferase [Candidatus Omnitrophota bacterium]